MKILTIAEQIVRLAPKMPIKVLQDVDKRISDWIASGGDPEGPYIEQQLRYMQNVEKKFSRMR